MSEWKALKTGIDPRYLHQCKRSTPEQRLDWLAAAQEFAQSIKPAPKPHLKKKTQKSS